MVGAVGAWCPQERTFGWGNSPSCFSRGLWFGVVTFLFGDGSGMGFLNRMCVSGSSLVGGRTPGALDQQRVFPSVPKEKA